MLRERRDSRQSLKVSNAFGERLSERNDTNDSFGAGQGR